MNADSTPSNIPIPDPTVLTTEQLRRELQSLRELLEARMAAMDEARQMHLTALRDERGGVQQEIVALRALHETKFAAVAQQLGERDERFRLLQSTAKDALNAAFNASGELVNQQTDANVRAAAKAELAFTKQIDALGDRVTELKERLDRGEGGEAGAAYYRAEKRLDLGQVLQALITVAAVAGLLIAVFHP